MNNQRGLTLLEVLVAVTILSLVVLSVSYLFTQNYSFSLKEEKRDMNVDIARNVMEELKRSLKNTALSQQAIYNQTVNLTLLRNNQPESPAAVLYYPNANDRQYEIRIRDLTIAGQTVPVEDANGTTYNFPVQDFFAHIQVEVVHTASNARYTLESYVEKR